MKRIIFSFLFVVFVLNTIAQQYTPMLELGKIWNMHHFDNFISPNNFDFNISLDNMVTVNGVVYFEASNGKLFREDVVNKKVYRLNNGVEELILDFDLVIGDDLILPLIFTDGTAFSKEVTEIGIDTFYGISNLKYYKTDCGERIIEGIGVQTTGLFDVSAGCSLLDFDEGDYVINMNQPLSVNDYFAQNNIKLFYNSSNKQLQLTNNTEDIFVEIYSVLGKKVIAEQINTIIDVSQLPKGIYFYNLSKDNAVKKDKVLIY